MKFKCASADIEFIDNAPIKFQYAVDINTTQQRAYEALENPATWPKWFHGMTAASPLYEDETGVWRVVTLNRFIRFREEFIAREAPGHLAYRVAAVSLPYADELVESFSIEPLGKSIRLTYRIGFRVHTSLWPIAFLIKRLGAHSYKKSLHAFKAYLESEQTSAVTKIAH